MPAKKQTSAATSAPPAPARRRSTRLSTGTTSRYFEQDDVDEEDAPPPPSSAKARMRAAADDGSQFGEASDDEDEEDDDEDPAEDSAEDVGAAPAPRKRSRGRPAKATPNKRAKPSRPVVQDEDEGEDDAEAAPRRKRGRPPKAAPKKPAAKKQVRAAASDEDEDDEDEDDEDERRITFEPLPQLRDDGGVAYEDTRLHPNTLAFLGDLKANNQRSWLKARDPEYRRSLKDWETFVATLTDKIIDADETVPELPLKDVIFRIYRDIRFSKDPTPYKPHYSAAWSRTGRKGPYACYYVHAEPGSCFVGGGLWHPDREALARLRRAVDRRPGALRRVLAGDRFRAAFLPSAAGAAAGDRGAKAVVAAFVAANREGALKTKPQGFAPDHPDIELLKLRNFTVGARLADADLTAADAQERIMDKVRAMVDYVTYLNRVVMPDPGEESDSESESESESDANSNSGGGGGNHSAGGGPTLLSDPENSQVSSDPPDDDSGDESAGTDKKARRPGKPAKAKAAPRRR